MTTYTVLLEVEPHWADRLLETDRQVNGERAVNHEQHARSTTSLGQHAARDDSAERSADEQVSIAAFARYLQTGDLPGREDASRVWDLLGDNYGSELILFDMLAAYRAGDDGRLLDVAKRVADRVESIVEDMIEEGLQFTR